MTKVSTIVKPPSASKRAQVLVQIPRNRLGKLNKRWQTKRRPKSTKIAKKKLVDAHRDGYPHVPILVLKLDRNRKSPEDVLISENGDSSEDSDSEDIDIGKTTHYKKQIIKKHSRASRERPTLNPPAKIDDNALCCHHNADQKRQSCQIKRDSGCIKSHSNNEQDNTANTSPTDVPKGAISSNKEELSMPGEVKPKIVVLENTMIAAPLRHAQNSAAPDLSTVKVTSPELHKNTIGKHVLPTAMIPQHQYSRLAIPLNNSQNSNQVNQRPDKMRRETNKTANYPNVVAQSDRHDFMINPQQEHPMDASKQSATAIRRKKSVPIRRRPTLTEDHENKTMQDAHKEQNQTLYTKHNGLELLSMVCTATTASNPIDINPQLHNTVTVNSDHRHQGLDASHEYMPRLLSTTERHEEKFKMASAPEIRRPVVSPLLSKATSPQQARVMGSKYPENDSNHRHPIFNGKPPPHPNAHLVGAVAHHFNPQLNTPPQVQQQCDTHHFLNKAIQQNGKQVQDARLQLEQPTIKQLQPPPPYYNKHQIISSSSASKGTYTINFHNDPLLLENAEDTHATQTTLMSSAKDESAPSSLTEHPHHQYLHRIMPPNYDKNAHPSNIRETTPKMEFRQSQFSQEMPNQQPSTAHTIPSPKQKCINQKEPWQIQYPKNTSYLDSNTLKEIDRNETCTLYYESQDGKGQTECTKQTIVYREQPENQTKSQENVVIHPQQNINAKEQPGTANCPSMLTMADVLAAGENEKLVRKLLRYYLPQQLLQMIIEILGEKFENKSGCDSQSNSTIASSSAQERSNKTVTSSVIKENPSVSTPPMGKTFSHRIENFINPSPRKNSVNAEPSTLNSMINLNKSHLNDHRENSEPHPQIGTDGNNPQTKLLTISPEKLKATLRVIIEANANLLKQKSATPGQSNSKASWTRPINEQVENSSGSSSSRDGNIIINNDSDSFKKIKCTSLKSTTPTAEEVKTPSIPNNVSENHDQMIESTKLIPTPQEVRLVSNVGEKTSLQASSKNNETNPGSTNVVDLNRRSSLDDTNKNITNANINNRNIPNPGDVNTNKKGSDLDPTKNNNNFNEKLSIKTEIPQHDLNHNFPFDIQFGPNDTVESMFARIMPSCFTILTLIQEMQNVNHVNWWPVDTEGNLFKIKMSLRGISIFLRRSKKLAVHLDPCVHHFFLFMLECLGTFRERVRKILETGHTLKENYISTSEGDIYKDVFIQLYDYLCCNRVTGSLNLRTRTEIPLTLKKESVSSDDGDEVFASSSEFSNIHQRHMVIIEKIKQRKIAEEEKNENYKKFISRLVDHSEDIVFPSTDEVNNEDTNIDSLESTTLSTVENVENNLDATSNGYSKFPTQISVREDLTEIKKSDPKRKVELIVIDSDSDEDATPSVAKKTRNKDSFQQLPAKRIIGLRSSYTIANIIDLDDDEGNKSLESNHKRKCSGVEEETNKRLRNDQNLHSSNNPSSIRNFSDEGVDQNLEYEYIDIKPQKEVIDGSIDSKFHLSETIRKVGITEELIKFQDEVQNTTHTVLTVEDIKKEIKRESEGAPFEEDPPRNEPIPQIIVAEDRCMNIEESAEVTDGNNCPNNTSSNVESIETIEAIQNFLRETNAAEAVTKPDSIEKSAVHKNDSNTSSKETTSNCTHVPIPCNSENRLVGIATPNIKDVDTINKKSTLNSSEQVQTLSSNPKKQKPEKIDLNDNSASELLRIMSQERLEKYENGDRATTQKLLSFRKPLRKIQNNDDISNISIPRSEKRQESVINSSLTRNQFKPVEEKASSPLEDKKLTSVITERRNSTEMNIPITVPNSPENQKQFFVNHIIESPEITRDHSEAFPSKTKPVEAEIPCRSTEQRMVSPTSTFTSPTGNSDRTVISSKISRRPVIEHITKTTVTECFKTPEIPCRYTAAAPGQKPQSVTNFKHTPLIATSSAELPRKEHSIEPSKSLRPGSSKELLRQAVTQKRLIHNMMQYPPVSPPERHNNRTQSFLTAIPSLQSIYNESVNTNGFISQTIKDEIGVLSKKESLGPSEYVQEITTLLRLPMIPKDFKDFYIFVTKQQILQFHQPIAFYIFLELLNQSGLKDYHKKFTEYTKKKFEDRVNSKKREDLRRQGQFRHKT